MRKKSPKKSPKKYSRRMLRGGETDYYVSDSSGIMYQIVKVKGIYRVHRKGDLTTIFLQATSIPAAIKAIKEREAENRRSFGRPISYYY